MFVTHYPYPDLLVRKALAAMRRVELIQLPSLHEGELFGINIALPALFRIDAAGKKTQYA